MKNIKICFYKNGKHYIFQCFGKIKMFKKYLSWSFINKFQHLKQKFKLIPKLIALTPLPERIPSFPSLFRKFLLKSLRNSHETHTNRFSSAHRLQSLIFFEK